jgi:hypothetical protein
VVGEIPKVAALRFKVRTRPPPYVGHWSLGRDYEVLKRGSISLLLFMKYIELWLSTEL